MMLSQNFLNWKQAQRKVNHSSKKMSLDKEKKERHQKFKTAYAQAKIS